MTKQTRIPLITILVLILVAMAARVESGFYLVAGGKSYKNLVAVAKSGSPFTSVQAALDSIADADADNPYLIYIAPGEYTGRFTMQPWVDIAGSGQTVTVLTATGGSGLSSATVTGASNCELRDLTVQNTGGGAIAAAMFAPGASPKLSRVTFTAEGGTSNNYGLVLTASSSILRDLTITVTGTGTAYTQALQVLSGSDVQADNLNVTSQGGRFSDAVINEQSSLLMRNSVLKALDGTDRTNAFGNATDSQGELIGVRMEAVNSAGVRPWAIISGDADLILRQCTAIADGAMQGGALDHQNGGTVVAEDCTLQGEDWGVTSVGTDSKAAVMRLHHCRIKGSTYTAVNDAYSSMYLSHCLLDGGITLGSPTCAGCSDENYAFSADACP